MESPALPVKVNKVNLDKDNNQDKEVNLVLKVKMEEMVMVVNLETMAKTAMETNKVKTDKNLRNN